MIEQYNIISSTAAGAVPTSTAKIETPEEFTQRIESAIVPKYAKAPNGRGGLVTISKDYTWAAKLIAARDTAIRSECAERAIEWVYVKTGLVEIGQSKTSPLLADLRAAIMGEP